MDARSDRNAIPLAVDLDGTLIATDLLWEGLFLLLRRNPLYLFLVPVWLMSGPARLKQEIAARVDIDPAGAALSRRAGRAAARGARGRPPHRAGDRHAAQIRRRDRRASRRVRRGACDRRTAQSHLEAANAQRWSRPMATAASTMPATAVTISPASTRRARRSSSRPTAMPRAGRPRTRRELFETPKPTFKTSSRCCASHQWAEERADRRADGAVARIFQHRHGRRLPARLRLVQRRGLGDLHRQRLLRPRARPPASDQAQPSVRQRHAVDPVRLVGGGGAAGRQRRRPPPSCRRCSGRARRLSGRRRRPIRCRSSGCC